MPKNKSKTPLEHFLLLPKPPSAAPIIDTHTHLASTFLASTFESYRQRYKQASHDSVFDMTRAFYADRNVEAIVDVWCEAPIRKLWCEFADAAWGGIQYWFVMGIHLYEAQHYTDDIKNDIIQAMAHSRCVGWGDMGLDYHNDNSPWDIQRSVFRIQVQQAVKLRKPLTIHTSTMLKGVNNDGSRMVEANTDIDTADSTSTVSFVGPMGTSHRHGRSASAPTPPYQSILLPHLHSW